MSNALNIGQLAGAAFGAKATTLKGIVDGYFKRYGRTPKVNYTATNVLNARDYFAKLIGETKIGEAKAFLSKLVVKYGIDINEAEQYLKQNPSYVRVLGSNENLDGGDPREALENAFDLLITKPLKWAGGKIGEIAGGTFFEFLKKVFPALIVVVVVYYLIQRNAKK